MISTSHRDHHWYHSQIDDIIMIIIVFIIKLMISICHQWLIMFNTGTSILRRLPRQALTRAPLSRERWTKTVLFLGKQVSTINVQNNVMIKNAVSKNKTLLRDYETKDDPNFSENKAFHPNYIYQLAIPFESWLFFSSTENETNLVSSFPILSLKKLCLFAFYKK